MANVYYAGFYFLINFLKNSSPCSPGYLFSLRRYFSSWPGARLEGRAQCHLFSCSTGAAIQGSQLLFFHLAVGGGTHKMGW